MKILVLFNSKTKVLSADLSRLKDEGDLTAYVDKARTLAGMMAPQVEQLELFMPAKSPPAPVAAE